MSRSQHFWLSFVYFSFFAMIGLVVPYFSVFLDGRGYSSDQIGELIAVITAMRVIAPNLFGFVADRSGKRIQIVRLGAFLALFFFLGLYFPGGFYWLMSVLILHTFFWMAIMPQLEVLTYAALGKNTERYSRIRMWGSIGFIVMVYVAGKWIEEFGSEHYVFIGTLGLVMLLVACLGTRHRETVNQEDYHQPLLPLLKDKFLWLFLTAGLLIQMSHAVYYNFFVLQMNDHGVSSSVSGLLISLGVVAEIGIFVYASRWNKKFGLKAVLLVSIALTVVRWLLLGWLPQYMSLVILAQLLHAASFGLVHTASVEFIYRYFYGPHQSKGQALFVSMSYGLGGVLGSLVSGYTWNQGTTAWLSYSLAALAACFALMAISAIPARCFSQDKLKELDQV